MRHARITLTTFDVATGKKDADDASLLQLFNKPASRQAAVAMLCTLL